MIILKEKWLRDKANLILRIVDCPTTRYQMYDYEQAAYDRFSSVLSVQTIKAIVNKILDLERNKIKKVG